ARAANSVLPSPLWGGSARSAGWGSCGDPLTDPHPQPLPSRSRVYPISAKSKVPNPGKPGFGGEGSAPSARVFEKTPMADQRRDSDQRPSPEALLEAARREERQSGRLKIFVGAAPGVGKTYEMLQQARARKQDGYDIVVGVVETHGRKETQALLEGLEVVPRRRLEYRGQSLEEMDLDAVIARHPQIVLVDELAHTNVPGSRHPKRYLDVEELLRHGIDVYTTVNIQHIESLNDVVAQITHVRVR